MQGLAFIALYVGCAVIAYAVVERRWRWRWREIEDGRVSADGTAGPFRDGGQVPRYRERAPVAVRLAAFTSLLLGQLFVPFAILAALTLVTFGFGLLLVPFLITTAKLYQAGLTLLRRHPRLAFFRAQNAATWSFWAHGILLLGALAGPLRSGARSQDIALLAIGVAAVLFALVAALHARWLLRVTRRWEDALFAATAHPSPEAVL